MPERKIGVWTRTPVAQPPRLRGHCWPERAPSEEPHVSHDMKPEAKALYRAEPRRRQPRCAPFPSTRQVEARSSRGAETAAKPRRAEAAAKPRSRRYCRTKLQNAKSYTRTVAKSRSQLCKHMQKQKKHASCLQESDSLREGFLFNSFSRNGHCGQSTAANGNTVAHF